MEGQKLIGEGNACILMVEDDPNHRELVVEAIRESKVSNSIFCVEHGREALRYLLREDKYMDEEKYPWPNLILLDLKLPDMDGKDVLHTIKSDESTRAIPVIVLTSSTLEEDIEECYRLGTNSYVIKPISFGEFIRKVMEIPLYWISLSRLPSQVGRYDTIGGEN